MKVSLVAITTLLAVVILPVQSQAHQTSEYYGSHLWDPPLTIPWRFTESVPTLGLGHRNRIIDAADAWNGIGSSLQFSRNTPDYTNWNPDVCTAPPLTPRRNGVHWRNDPNAFAYHTGCAYASDPSVTYSFQLVFDSNEPWWTGLDVVPTTHYDLWSAATHEFGHATGFRTGGTDVKNDGSPNPGHWNDNNSTLCPVVGDANYLERESMCGTLLPGTRVARTPDDHDTHTFLPAY